jgi:CheY-like chemotaxis protein
VQPLRFLLIEDDAAHAKLVRMALEEHRVTNSVECVGDGAEAFAYLAGEGQYAGRPRPDVILLDLKLPKIDGHEVLKRVKEDQSLRSIPVVVLTTSDAEADRLKAYMSHANSYVVKPIDFDSFDRIVRDLDFYWAAVNTPPP